MTERYFAGKARAPHTEYVVKDRKYSDIIIATCLYREQANLIARALNEQIAHQAEKAAQVPSKVTP